MHNSASHAYGRAGGVCGQVRSAASGGEASFLPKKRGLMAGASDAGKLVRHGADGRGGRQKVLCPANSAALQARRRKAFPLQAAGSISGAALTDEHFEHLTCVCRDTSRCSKRTAHRILTAGLLGPTGRPASPLGASAGSRVQCMVSAIAGGGRRQTRARAVAQRRRRQQRPDHTPLFWDQAPVKGLCLCQSALLWHSTCSGCLGCLCCSPGCVREWSV